MKIRTCNLLFHPFLHLHYLLLLFSAARMIMFLGKTPKRTSPKNTEKRWWAPAREWRGKGNSCLEDLVCSFIITGRKRGYFSDFKSRTSCPFWCWMYQYVQIWLLLLNYLIKRISLEVLSNANTGKKENELKYFFTKTSTGAFQVTFILFLCLWHRHLSLHNWSEMGCPFYLCEKSVVSCHLTIASPYNIRVKKDLLVICWILVFNNDQVWRPLRSESMVKMKSLKTTGKQKGQRIPSFQQYKPNCGGYRGERKKNNNNPLC